MSQLMKRNTASQQDMELQNQTTNMNSQQNQVSTNIPLDFAMINIVFNGLPEQKIEEEKQNREKNEKNGEPEETSYNFFQPQDGVKQDLQLHLSEKEKYDSTKKFLIVIKIILCYLTFMVLTLVIPFYGLYLVFNVMIEKRSIRNKLKVVLFYFSNIGIVYSFFQVFYLKNENPLIVMIVHDCIYFLLTTFLVFSYHRICLIEHIYDYKQNENHSTWDHIFQHLRLMCVMLLQSYNPNSYEKQLCRFDYFQFEMKVWPSFIHSSVNENMGSSNLKISQFPLKEYLDKYDKRIQVRRLYSYFIAAVIIAKICFVFFYIDIQPDTLQVSSLFQMVVVVLTYIQAAQYLNDFLGNCDLIRKRKRMERLSDYLMSTTVNIRVSKDEKFTYDQNIKQRIANPLELELWDDLRKYLLGYQSEYLEDLEVTYFCIIFYFLFVTLVCASAFYEINWIFQSDSIILLPINVILNTFNFLYLSMLMLFRIKEGTKFNETFQDLKNDVSKLKDTVSDLITCGPEIFKHTYQNNEPNQNEKQTSKKSEQNQESQSQNKEQNEQQNQIEKPKHGSENFMNKSHLTNMIQEEINSQANYYIEKSIPYLDRVYTKREVNLLKRKLLKNLDMTYSKILSSIALDEDLHKYKFGGFLEVNFTEFAITVFLAFITSLPTIVPKFEVYFQLKE